jgi:hypothetical protein
MNLGISHFLTLALVAAATPCLAQTGTMTFYSIGLSAKQQANELPHYVFVLPEGYVGWIQVIFMSPGAPELKPEHGKVILRINVDGMFRTSTVGAVFAGSHDEFLYRSLRPDGAEALRPVPSTYFCGEELRYRFLFRRGRYEV